MSQLQDKVAIVTGASKGIGAAIAKGFAAAGAKVLVGYSSDQAGAKRIVTEIEENGGATFPFGADVSQASHAKRLIAAAIDHYGQIDILVNNAGYFRFSSFEQATEDEFHRMYNTNVLGTLLTMQAASPYLRDGSAIINVSSAGISTLSPGASVYLSSKAAVVAMSRIVAKELGPRGIRVNVLCPGATETEGAAAVGVLGGPMVAKLLASTPLGRIGQPDDMVGPALFLASDQARWVTGEVIYASGGTR